MQDIRGDILLAQGDIKNAYIAYNVGIKSNTSEILKYLLGIKLNNLPN